MTALGELLLDFEHHDRGMSSRLGSGTPRTILVGVVDAKLAGSSSLKQIADRCGLPLGTVKAARSRIPGLREAMDEVGRGTSDWPNLDEENAAVTRFWRERSPRQREAWIEAFWCEVVHRMFDEDADDTALEFWNAVPARESLERLWGASAWVQAELLDLGHRFVDDPPWWSREAIA